MTTLSAEIGTVAALATGEVPVLRPDQTCGDARRALLGRRYDTVRDLPVCTPDHRVVGVMRIEDLVAAAEGQRVASLMDADPPVLAGGVDDEVAAWHAAQEGESSLIVVEDGARFRGVVAPDRLLAVLLHEHDEDVARLGGFVASARDAVNASRESVGRRLLHRLPWLLVGLTGALLAAGLMGGFEERLRTNLTLALFLPGVVYLADAVGTQTEALVIRGLAIGVPIREVAGRELATGLLAGVALGGLFVPLGLAFWGEREVILAVAVALAAACAVANAVAMLLPAVFQRLNVDPAFGSGPLATVLQDLLSIAIYLGVAVAMVP